MEKLSLVTLENGKVRRFRSFASKFASAFIDSDRFPILDSLADQSLCWHLESVGTRIWRDGSYEVFFQRIEELEARAGFRGHRRDLDRYLWLSGLYRRWRENPAAGFNSEAKRLFEEDLADGGRLGRATWDPS